MLDEGLLWVAACDDVPVRGLDACMSDASSGAGIDQEEGFEHFVREYRPLLVAFLRRRVPEEDAQDVAQETMVRLMRYHGQPAEALRPLMYRIGLNVLADRGRRDGSRLSHAHVSLDEADLALPSLEPAQDERVAHQQALVALRGAMLRLPPRCREIYLLNRIEGMSYTEIARHCGISVKAVEKHIGKALSLLRVHLRGDNGGHTHWP